MSLYDFTSRRIMCLTQDGLPWTHVEQARRLCVAGAEWIQLRMKGAALSAWTEVAKEVVRIARDHGAICVVNDNVDVALAADAHGVHLGKTDMNWTAARCLIGAGRLLGGTVNNPVDGAGAQSCGELDYVGVGPWRFTSNKQNLAPVLGKAGVATTIQALNGIPAWVIGGITVSDFAEVRSTGAEGLAVSSALFIGGNIEANFHAFREQQRLEKNTVGHSTPPSRSTL